MDLIRSGLPRDVEGDGGRYWLRPPTVEEALALFALLPGALAGDEEDFRQYERILKNWLPDELSRILTGSPEVPREVAQDVLSLVNMGLPKTDREVASSMTFEDLNSMSWDLIVIDLAQSYGVWIEDVLRMPWPRFILLVTRQDAADARYTLRRLLLHILPHIQESKGTIDTLYDRAGYREEGEKREARIDPELRERLDTLEREVGWARLRMTNPPKGKTFNEMAAEFSKLDKELCDLRREINGEG